MLPSSPAKAWPCSRRTLPDKFWDLGQAKDHLQQHFSRARPVLKARSLLLWALLLPRLLASLAVASVCCPTDLSTTPPARGNTPATGTLWLLDAFPDGCGGGLERLM